MHKKIGILGGMSAESTIDYYRLITRTYTERFGDYNYPEIIIYSMTFQDYADWPHEGRWDLIERGLSKAARQLEATGVDFIIIACNTVHEIFDRIKASVSIPMISISEAVLEKILPRGIKTVGLLGTKVTMEKTFYQDTLGRKGVRVIVPDPNDRQYIDDIIYSEFVIGKVKDSSVSGFIKIIRKLADDGAEGIILGCTELGALINEQNCGMPVFDSTIIHATAALDYALEQD